MATWKRDAASGLVILVPIIVTLYVVLWLYGSVANVPLLEAVVDGEFFPAVEIGGQQIFSAEAVAELARVFLTLLLFGVLVLSIGYMMRTAVGGIVEEAIDDVINRVPGLRIVYNASKMAVETALSGGGDLQAPVKVEPWNGMRMTAFKTGKRTSDGREILFLPTSPNITTGYVLEVDPENLTETDEKVEDALTRVLSAGFGETDQDVMMGMIDSDADGDQQE